MAPLPIIDTHVHLWDPRRLRYPWLDDLPALNRPFLPEDYGAATAGVPVRKWVFVEGGAEPSLNLEEVGWVTALAEVEPRLCGMVAQVALEQGEAIHGELARLAANPLVKGVRRLLQQDTDTDFCLRPEFVAGVRLLSEFGFTFDLCIRHGQIPAVTELARRCPQVTLILDHAGKPPIRERAFEPWKRDLAGLAALPNVACKLSGLTTEADWQDWEPADLRPWLDHALDCFGFGRVLFGGDWPVATLATTWQRWFEVVSETVASASAVDRQQLFQDNAERLYRV